MAQDGVYNVSEHERRAELPPIGVYSLQQSHFLTDAQDITQILCTSNRSPIWMSIGSGNYGMLKKGEGKGPHYRLHWPTNMIGAEVVDLVRELGADNGEYSSTRNDGGKAIEVDETSSEEEKEFFEDKIRGGSDLDEALHPDFSQLAVGTPDLYLGWSRDELKPQEEPFFSLTTPDNRPVNTPDIVRIVQRTTTVGHLGHVGFVGAEAALDDLAAAYEKYSTSPPPSLFE